MYKNEDEKLNNLENEDTELSYSDDTEELFDDEFPEDVLDTDEVSEQSEEQEEYSDEFPEDVLDTDEVSEQLEEQEEYSDEFPEDVLDTDEVSEQSEEQEEFSDEFPEDVLDTDEVSEQSEEKQEDVPPEPEAPKEPEKPKFVFEDVKKEIQSPVKLTATIKYLSSLPILGKEVKERFLDNLKKETDDVKIRAIRVATQKEMIAEYKQNAQPYIITHFTNQENICNVDKECKQKLFHSVYYEVSNPVTNKNVMITSQMFHNITVHSMVYFNEPLLNLGNSPQGFFDAYLPCADLIKALEKSNAPKEVFEELEAVKDKINYLEEQRFASVIANIQYDMSVFEQNEYEKENNIVPFYALLRTMVDWGAEDIHIKAYCRPLGVLGGNVTPCPSFPEFLTPERTKYYANYLMTPSQQQQFEETLEMDNSFYVPGVARFRCNIYNAQGTVGMVFRVIPTKIRPVEVLGVPMILKKLVFERLGLVLVTGQTGSGKTTTLAAIVEFCNVNRAIHILTLENPVEYVYQNKSAIFTQRAIEIDSLSFPMAMRGALRQKPDIILIGEMRDPDTIIAGLKAAETGHLVMSTLHTNDAVQTINRIVNTFPPHEQETIRVQVGSTIKACVAQRLIPRFDKPGRVCAIEVMLVTPNARGQNTRGYIIRNEVPALYKVVATSGYDGMQSMNMALFEHYKNGVITPDDALSYSDNPDEVTRWMREDAGLSVQV
ncbi:MAG: PilT/PilU family type 4a pilus ATPase [Candidatus Sericytochromatia bacterium]